MNDCSTTKILWRYIKHHILTIALFFVFTGVFAGTFYLYDIQQEGLYYAFGLCFFIGFVLFLFHLIKYYTKHKQLVRIGAHASLLGEQLPHSRNLLEEDYRNIVMSLLTENQTLLTEWQSEKNETIDYYTTWVHQIKTPIAVIRLILQEEDTTENKELLAELFRIEQYVDMVLSYLRLDSSSNDFIFKQYSLDEIIKKCIRKYAGQFVRKKISLNYVNTDISVLTDEKWLGFMIEQLLSNAIKYTEKGSVTIAVHNRILTISDTGIGIAAEDQPRIFEKGFTGYNGRTGKKSTGLGLYLCKRTADKLSHGISVNSRPGVGTTVSLDLNSVHLDVE